MRNWFPGKIGNWFPSEVRNWFLGEIGNWFPRKVGTVPIEVSEGSAPREEGRNNRVEVLCTCDALWGVGRASLGVPKGSRPFRLVRFPALARGPHWVTEGFP